MPTTRAAAVTIDARTLPALNRSARIFEAFDKLPVGGFPVEANPFLGWRAIRMCIDQPEVFGVQLRALLRAAVHGDVRIMLPLVGTLDEVRTARELLDEAARVLESRGAQFRRDVPLGIMVETPAAAVSSGGDIVRAGGTTILSSAGGDRWRQQITLWPTHTTVLFALPGALRFTPETEMRLRYSPADGALETASPLSDRVNYEVVSTNSPGEGLKWMRPPVPSAAPSVLMWSVATKTATRAPNSAECTAAG